jgi:hypothetical protein
MVFEQASFIPLRDIEAEDIAGEVFSGAGRRRTPRPCDRRQPEARDQASSCASSALIPTA